MNPFVDLRIRYFHIATPLIDRQTMFEDHVVEYWRYAHLDRFVIVGNGSDHRDLQGEAWSLVLEGLRKLAQETARGVHDAFKISFGGECGTKVRNLRGLGACINGRIRLVCNGLLQEFRDSAESSLPGKDVLMDGYDPNVREWKVQGSMTYTANDKSEPDSTGLTLIHNLQVALCNKSTGTIEVQKHFQYLTHHFFKLDTKSKREKCLSLIRSAPSSDAMTVECSEGSLSFTDEEAISTGCPSLSASQTIQSGGSILTGVPRTLSEAS